MKKISKKYCIITLAAVLAATSIGAAAVTWGASAEESVEHSRFEMVEGASIRTVSPKGLRFIAEMGEDVYEDLTTEEAGVVKKMGMFIVPVSYLNDSSKYSNGVLGVMEQSYDKLTTKIEHVFYSSDGSVDNKIYASGEYYRANGVISNLFLKNYDRDFIGIAYISETSGENTTYTYADFNLEDNVRDSLYVASKAYEDYKDEERRKVFNEYVIGAHLETLGMTETVTKDDEGNRTGVTYTYKGNTYNTIQEVVTAENISLTLNLEAPTLFFTGITEKETALTATVTDNNGTPATIDTYIGWDSSNKNVATVDGNGTLKVVGYGETDITATFMGQTKTKKVSVFDGTFENVAAVPSFMWTENAGTATIDKKDGDKCLVIPNTGMSPKLKVTLDFLASYFADENVQYVAFDAKTDSTKTSNFRRYTTNGTTMTNVTYEINNTKGWGINATEWKSYYFTRADYEAWVENDLTEHYLITTGGFTAGDNLYVDNIRPVTAKEYEEDLYGYESGRFELSGTNLLYYTTRGADTWQMGIGCNSTANIATAYGITNTNVSQGKSAFYFTKPAGKYTVRFNSSGVALNDLRGTGYYAFDLYVPEGADATLTNQTTTWSVGELKAGQWTTVYVNRADDKPVDITDTTGGTYAIDHFRAVTEEEFNAAMLDFEAGTGGLRDNTAASENRVYYYAGADHASKTWSMIIMNNGATLSDPHFDNEITHNGGSSLAVTKSDNGAYWRLSPSSTLYATLKDGFTFWIYSTVTVNGRSGVGNITNGYDAVWDADFVLRANTWTQITVDPEDINTGNQYRFLGIKGSSAGTFYIDDIRPLGADNGEGGEVGGGEEPEQESYLTYNAQFDEVEGALTLNASSYTGSGSMLPSNDVSIEEDMSYFAFNEKFGLNDFLVFDITGDNMPIISFFNNEVTKTIYNQEQDANVRGWIIANGMTLNNGTLFGGVDGAHANRYAVIGPNKIAYKFDDNGTPAVQYRYNTSNNAMPWGLSMATLQSANDQYKIIIGFTENSQDSTKINLHIYGLNMMTGQTIKTTVLVRALYEEGYIAMHGHFGRTTVIDKVYPIHEDTTIDALVEQYMPTTIVYNGERNGNGGLVLEQSAHISGGLQSPTEADMSYIAFRGEYGLNDYVVFDFTGDNMPYVSFFNNQITNTVFNRAQDENVAGWVIANGLRDNDGTWQDSETSNTASRLTVYGPKKIINYTSNTPNGEAADVQFRQVIDGSSTTPSAISMRTLQSVKDTYRAIMGVEDGSSAGKVNVRVYVINMVTGDEVLNVTKECTIGNLYTYSEGNIILYGRFHKETVLDKVFGVHEDANFTDLCKEYAFVKNVDYSNEKATFDAYAYSGPTNGQWTVDGVKQESNPIDYRTVEHLTTYKDAGFNIYLAQDSINVNSTTWKTDGEVIMDRANEAGLKVILTDKRIQDLSEPITVTSTGTSGTAWEIGEGKRFKNLAALDSYIAECLSLYKDHPAFYGVMLGDEPSYQNAYCYGEVYKAIKRVAPDVYVQYNLLPLNNNKDSIKYRYPNLATDNSITNADIENAYVAYLEAFLDSMGVDYVQYDHYPMKSEMGIFVENPYISPTYLRGLQLVGELAKTRDIAVKVVAQTCVQNTSGEDGMLYLRQITEDDARWINNSLLGFGVKEINYFTYWTKQANYSEGEWFVDGGSFVNRDGTTTELYNFMKTIMAENQAFAGTIKSFDYRGSRVYNGKSVFSEQHISWLKSNDTFGCITNVTTSQEATLVTELYDWERYNYMYMLMNTIDTNEKNAKGQDTTQTITVTFNDYYTNAYVYQNGVRTSVALANGVYTVTLTAGQAVYVLPY